MCGFKLGAIREKNHKIAKILSLFSTPFGNYFNITQSILGNTIKNPISFQ